MTWVETSILINKTRGPKGCPFNASCEIQVRRSMEFKDCGLRVLSHPMFRDFDILYIEEDDGNKPEND